MARIHMLGGFSISTDDAVVRLPSAGASILAAFLLWHSDEWIPRSRLRGMLWPDSPEERAAANLRQALHRLRHTLSEAGLDSVLEMRRDAVRVTSAATELEIDVHAFERTARAALVEPDGDLSMLTAAVALCPGPFLEGLDAEWIDDQRRELDSLYLRVLKGAIGALREAGLYESAIPHARRWVTREPLNEEAHRILMQLYSDSGYPAGALQQFEDCRATLAEELGIPPSVETLELCEQIGLHPDAPRRRTRHHPPKSTGSRVRHIADDPLYKAGLLLALGQKRADLGEVSDALEHLEKADAIYKQHGDEEGQARTALAIGAAHVGSSTGPRPDLAVAYVEQALAYFEEQPESPVYVRALYLASFVSGLVGNEQRQFDLAETGLELADRLGNKDYRARFETLLAIGLMTEYRLEEAEERLGQVGHLLPYLSEMADVAMFMVYHACVPLLAGKLKVAEERHTELLAIVETLPFGALRAGFELPARMLLMTVLYFEGKYAQISRLNPLPDWADFLPEHAIHASTLLTRPKRFAEACRAAALVLRANLPAITDEQAPMFIRQMCEFMWDAGLIAESAEWAEVGIAFAAEREWPALEAVFLAYRARTSAGLEDADAALADCERADALRDPGDHWTELVSFWSRALAGDAALRDVAVLAEELGFGHYLPQLESAKTLR